MQVPVGWLHRLKDAARSVPGFQQRTVRGRLHIAIPHLHEGWRAGAAAVVPQLNSIDPRGLLARSAAHTHRHTSCEEFGQWWGAARCARCAGYQPRCSFALYHFGRCLESIHQPAGPLSLLPLRESDYTVVLQFRLIRRPCRYDPPAACESSCVVRPAEVALMLSVCPCSQGQTRPVVVYRLLSAGTMEEGIYSRCVRAWTLWGCYGLRAVFPQSFGYCWVGSPAVW